MDPIVHQVAPIDLALEQFKSKIPELNQYEEMALSESDTRSKLIDEILHILGWREQFIERETHVRTSGRFLDYKLRTTVPIMVVEAKKNTRKLEIPPSGGRHFRVGGAISKTLELSAAIEQCREYAQDEGITFCCISNGFQFAFFRANNSYGVPWDRQFITVFRDLTDIINKFSEFYEALSFESVSAGRHGAAIPVSELKAHQASRFKTLDELSVQHQQRDRNALFPYTKELIRHVFQGLDNEDASPQLLENCYVESARESSYERGIGELLREHRTRIPNLAAKVQTSRKNAGEFQSHVEELALRNSNSGSVTLILGTLGAGKTTFLNRFRKVFARELIEASFIWLQVSFNEFVESEDELQFWMREKITNILEETYGELGLHKWETLCKIYQKEITQLKEGVLQPIYNADPKQFDIALSGEIKGFLEQQDRHLQRCLSYVATKFGRQIILIFDNADQHSPALQNEVFLIAQKNAKDLRCLCLISLREESYWKNKDFGGLSAFHSTAFQLVAPRIEQVIAKRFKYAAKIILDNSEEAALAKFAKLNPSLTPENISKIFNILHTTLLGEDRRFIRFLEFTSPGEVRRSLDFVARFLTSGHTNINRLLERVQAGATVPVGFHEFLQAVMLGDRMHYKENASDVINIFAVDGKADQSHFNRLSVLARVITAIGESTQHGKGYIPVIDVIRDCENIGINPETSISIIGLLTEKRLLATETLDRVINPDANSIRATAAAMYYVNELCINFTYLDMVLIDTAIGDETVRQELIDGSRRIFNEEDRLKKLELRVDRARRFVSYLEVEFSKSSLSKPNQLFGGPPRDLVGKLSASFNEQASTILASARAIFRR